MVNGIWFIIYYRSYDYCFKYLIHNKLLKASVRRGFLLIIHTPAVH